MEVRANLKGASSTEVRVMLTDLQKQKREDCMSPHGVKGTVTVMAQVGASSGEHQSGYMC